MVEAAAKFTLDKGALDTEIAKEKEWNKVLIANHEGNVITTKSLGSVTKEEIQFFMGCLEDRDKTIGHGFILEGVHFDVHRFHPPLVYGRRGGPDEGEGIAFCRVKSKISNQFVYFVITYVLPIISARAIPQMLEFAKKFLGEANQIEFH
eukprot:TRINITY_DN580_c0_g1_i1.p1 TRINITY_DN580_c0_g1~~TRINITY_DN580_c0_g1_i1.p1  ORF type:complete len:150 (+),score=35.76 TRINITY_DN580_c0_g1_i1:40-489(+)